MTAYDSQVVVRRLAHLEDATAKLEKARPLTVDDLQKKDALSDASFYRIQTCIEAIIDIGNHILAEIYQQHPSTYKDTLRSLGEAGVISQSLVDENLPMVDFRNILVHHYVDIDPEKALVNMSKSPQVFRQFAEELAVFLQTRQP